MARSQTYTDDDIVAAIESLDAAGEKITVDTVRERTGGGDRGRIGAILKKWNGTGGSVEAVFAAFQATLFAKAKAQAETDVRDEVERRINRTKSTLHRKYASDRQSLIEAKREISRYEATVARLEIVRRNQGYACEQLARENRRLNSEIAVIRAQQESASAQYEDATASFRLATQRWGAVYDALLAERRAERETTALRLSELAKAVEMVIERQAEQREVTKGREQAIGGAIEAMASVLRAIQETHPTVGDIRKEFNSLSQHLANLTRKQQESLQHAIQRVGTLEEIAKRATLHLKGLRAIEKKRRRQRKVQGPDK